ncbi:hypothetical protein NAEX_01834 [Nannocystis exedens]|nr:hypothetical protein NAEX_01834 [Nannocystis exedens]
MAMDRSLRKTCNVTRARRSTAEGLVIPLPEDGLLERAVSGADVARASSSLATERSSRRRYRSTCRSLRLVRMLAARPK